MKSNIIQLIKFCIVGASNTAIGYVVYIIALKVFRYGGWLEGTDIYISWVLMFFISVGWAFYWNNKFVFKSSLNDNTYDLIAALIKTYISYAFSCLFLAEILLYIAVSKLYISEYIAPITILFITAPVNFIIQKIWVYK